MLKEKAKPCAGLSEKVLNEMYSDGYSPKSVGHHVRPIYNRLARYCEEHFEGMYSVDAGEAFIRTIQRKNQSKEQTDLNRNSIERLNHALDGDFHWRPAKSKLKPYAAPAMMRLLPDTRLILSRLEKPLPTPGAIYI